MARTGPGSQFYHRNIRLDSFLKRNTKRAVYERIRAYEACVVQSDSINKVYMHVILSDERVYLTEVPPRTLTSAFSFSSLRGLELINDLPDFLSRKDRERCQHIKIVYVPEKPSTKGQSWLQSNDQVFAPDPPFRSISPLKPDGYAAHSPIYTVKPSRSASCPNQETLGLQVPHPPTRPHSSASMYPFTTDQRSGNTHSGQAPRRVGLLLSGFLKRDREANEAELHLYPLSPLSTLYLNLQSSWTSFIIRSTLILDPLYRKKYCTSSSISTGKHLPVVGWEQTAHLFTQLNAELLQEGLSVESLYLLLQELHTAAHRSITLRRLFWRSNDLCLFLVQTLEDGLGGSQSGVYATDRLLMSTLTAQTLAVMFRETEVEPARLNLLSANNGALASRMLLALICDSEPQTPNASKIRVFLAEYLDAACSLLFELLLLGHEMSRYSLSDHILSVGWILQVLQPHPHLLSFIGYQALQVVLVLSSPQESSTLSPVQSVLLFQRCRLLLASVQYSNHLKQHLKSNFREEFRYSVNVSCAEAKLSPHYPISSTIQRLVEQIQTLILH